jgi:hypothetical protein
MTQTNTDFRELAHRRNDGLDVRLLWNADDDRLLVALSDGKTGEGFEVEVGAGERPLDVFHHPFAYRAVREASDRRVERGTLAEAA